MQILSTLAVASIASVALAADVTTTETTVGSAALFHTKQIGKAPKFMLYPCAADAMTGSKCNDGNSKNLMITFGGVSELDVNGAALRSIVSLASQEFTITTVDNKVSMVLDLGAGKAYPGKNAGCPDATGKITVNAEVVTTETKVTDAGADLTIPANSLEWTIDTTDVTFCTAAKSLSVAVDIKAVGGVSKDGAAKINGTTTDAKTSETDFGGVGSMTYPLTALLDGTVTGDVAVESSSKADTTTLKFFLPVSYDKDGVNTLAKTVNYDPFIAFADTTSPASTLLVSSVLSIATAIAAFALF